MKRSKTEIMLTHLTHFLKWLYRPFQIYSLHTFYFRMRKILPLHAFKKHGYIVASSGSGKSEFIKVLLYRELIKKNPKSSVIVIDPH